jgi:RNA polymerase sigma-70 factor (ECF subfamily)
MRNEQVKSGGDIPDALVKAACDGNKEAFGELFRSLYGRVHRTVWGMVGDESEAHDVAQEAWIKAWEKKETYNFQSLYSTWVHRIAVNCALDALRRRKRYWSKIAGFMTKDEGPKTKDGKDITVSEESFDQSPSSLVQKKELGQRIQSAVSRLPEEQRTVLVLREYEGYSYGEIADILGIKPGTVMSRLHHARQKLQNSLSKDLS